MYNIVALSEKHYTADFFRCAISNHHTYSMALYRLHLQSYYSIIFLLCHFLLFLYVLINSYYGS